ncbi:MAG: type II secretion system protein GspL [Proteobacteria bacterium]|nr:type II secretion system protein GspL [Pseudomonadota bacterium]
MSDILLTHYNTNHADQATWALCNTAGELTGKITTGSLDELHEMADGHPVIVLLNSQCLHLNQLQLPTTNQQKMLKAVPYAIEEFIADDIENFHFVISKNKHDNSTSVVGIDKTTLQEIIDTFQQAGITIEKIIPDALCLAAEKQQWACLLFEDDAYLQIDTTNGMSFPREIFNYALEKKLEEYNPEQEDPDGDNHGDENQNTPEKILLFSEQEDNSANDASTDIAKIVAGHDIELIKVIYNTHPLVIFCGNYKQALPLNLLQHKFKTKRKSSGYWPHWRFAASLAVVWLVLHLGFTGFQLSQLEKENRISKAKIEKIYKKAFPKSKKIVNPRVQMEQKLKELKSGSGNSNNGLLFLLSESFGTLSKDRENIKLRTLTYRNNRMEIGLEGSNLQAIESLNKNLNSNPAIKSEIASSSSEKNKVRGQLRIEGRS